MTTEDKIESLEQKIANLSYIMGIMSSVLYENMDKFSDDDLKACAWIDKAIENIIYKDKPLPFPPPFRHHEKIYPDKEENEND